MLGSAKWGNLKAWPSTQDKSDEQQFQFSFNKSSLNKSNNETGKTTFNFKSSQQSDENTTKKLQVNTKNEDSQQPNEKSKNDVRNETENESKIENQTSENAKPNDGNEPNPENTKNKDTKTTTGNPHEALFSSAQNSNKQKFQMKFNSKQQENLGNFSFKRSRTNNKSTKKRNDSEINNTSELYRQVRSIVDDVFKGKDQNAKLSESLSSIVSESTKEIAEHNKQKSRESKNLQSPKNEGPDINLIYTDPSMATQDPSVTMMIDPFSMTTQDPCAPFGIPMIPNQIPMMPNQIPMMPNQIPMMPNQIPMVPNQMPMMPNQMPMMPIMVPASPNKESSSESSSSSSSDSESSSYTESSSESDSSSSYSEYSDYSSSRSSSESSSESESEEKSDEEEEEEEEEKDERPMNVTKFEHSVEKEFDGIMNYLNRQSEGNVHDKGTVEITSNSVKPSVPPFTIFNPEISPKNLVDYDKKNYYFSQDNGDAIIKFDFKDRKVKLQYYTIRSLNNAKDANLKNWVIEGSKNDRSWNIIDERIKDETLKQRNITACFKVNHKSEYYRFIRLRQTGQSWCTSDKHNKFGSEYMEFFGQLKEPLPPEEQREQKE